MAERTNAHERPRSDTTTAPRPGAGSRAPDLPAEAVLIGGPADLPAQERHCQVTPGADKVRVRHGRGYEYFERSNAAADAGQARLIFRWSYRTNIAE